MSETERIRSQSMMFSRMFRFPLWLILVFLVIIWGILIPQWSVEAAESEKSTEVSDTFRFSDNDGDIYPKSC